MSSQLKILFLHGWHSIVGGVKPSYLEEQGFNVRNPALDDDDFEYALRTAQLEFDLFGPDIIVGSSRGGAIAMNIDSGDVPLVLLCPAWKRWGNKATLKRNSIVLHSLVDDVVPFSDSVELIRRNKLPKSTLIQIGSDHRLATPEPLSVMAWACNVLATNANRVVDELGFEFTDWDFDEDQSHVPTFPRATETAEALCEGSYLCDTCGEVIVVPIDRSEGHHQSYVEDCPVCCNANTIHVHFRDDGSFEIASESEQDHEN